MAVYALRRMLHGSVVLAILSFVIFALLRLMPGDPAAALAGAGASAADIARIRTVLGLDDPLPNQFIGWLYRLASNTEVSILTRRLVTIEIAERIPYTFGLATISMTLAVVTGVPLGFLAAVRRGSWLDRILAAIATIGISTPAFLVGVLLIFGLAVTYRVFPVGGAGSWQHWVLPSVALALTHFGTIARTTKAAARDALAADYARTARAKGMKRSRVLRKHVLRNAVIPVMAVIGVDLGALLAGTAVTEFIFNWPGLGRLMVEALHARDYPLIQSLVLFFGALFVVINIAVDVLYTAVDPRIQRS